MLSTLAAIAVAVLVLWQAQILLFRSITGLLNRVLQAQGVTVDRVGYLKLFGVAWRRQHLCIAADEIDISTQILPWLFALFTSKIATIRIAGATCRVDHLLFVEAARASAATAEAAEAAASPSPASPRRIAAWLLRLPKSLLAALSSRAVQVEIVDSEVELTCNGAAFILRQYSLQIEAVYSSLSSRLEGSFKSSPIQLFAIDCDTAQAPDLPSDLASDSSLPQPTGRSLSMFAQLRNRGGSVPPLPPQPKPVAPAGGSAIRLTERDKITEIAPVSVTVGLPVSSKWQGTLADATVDIECKGIVATWDRAKVHRVALLLMTLPSSAPKPSAPVHQPAPSSSPAPLRIPVRSIDLLLGSSVLQITGLADHILSMCTPSIRASIGMRDPDSTLVAAVVVEAPIMDATNITPNRIAAAQELALQIISPPDAIQPVSECTLLNLQVHVSPRLTDWIPVLEQYADLPAKPAPSDPASPDAADADPEGMGVWVRPFSFRLLSLTISIHVGTATAKVVLHDSMVQLQVETTPSVAARFRSIYVDWQPRRPGKERKDRPYRLAPERVTNRLFSADSLHLFYALGQTSPACIVANVDGMVFQLAPELVGFFLALSTFAQEVQVSPRSHSSPASEQSPSQQRRRHDEPREQQQQQQQQHGGSERTTSRLVLSGVLNNVTVYMSTDKSPAGGFHFNECRLQMDLDTLEATVVGKRLRIIYDKSPFMNVAAIKVIYRPGVASEYVVVFRDVRCTWTVGSYFGLVEAMDAVSVALDGGAPLPPPEERSVWRLEFTQVQMTAAISPRVTLDVGMDWFRGGRVSGEPMYGTMTNFQIAFEDSKWLHAATFSIRPIAPESIVIPCLEVDSAAKACPLPRRAWDIEFSRFVFTLPHAFQFGPILDDILDCRALINHCFARIDPNDDGSTPAVRMSFLGFEVIYEDDPFQSQLGFNYLLSQDEQHERQRRAEALERQVQPLIAKGKVSNEQLEVMRRRLDEKNAELYIKRHRVASKMRKRDPPLFKISMSRYDIAISPQGLDERVLAHLVQELDTSRTRPALAGVDGWHVSITADRLRIAIRDYPIPMLLVEQTVISGKIMLVEQAVLPGFTERKFHDDVLAHLDPPISTLHNRTPSKIFYDLVIEGHDHKSMYTLAASPALVDVAFAVERLVGVDPFTDFPLPFWDSWRFLWHGRATLVVTKSSIKIGASLDPYNVNEYQLLRADTVRLSQYAGGMDLVANQWTASSCVRYGTQIQEACIAVIPLLKIHVRFQWDCSGDSSNHYLFGGESFTDLQDPDQDIYDPFRAMSMVMSLDVQLLSRSDTLRSADVTESRETTIIVDPNSARRLMELGRVYSFPTLCITTRDHPLVPVANIFKLITDIHLNVTTQQVRVTLWQKYMDEFELGLIMHYHRVKLFMQLTDLLDLSKVKVTQACDIDGLQMSFFAPEVARTESSRRHSMQAVDGTPRKGTFWGLRNGSQLFMTARFVAIQAQPPTAARTRAREFSGGSELMGDDSGRDSAPADTVEVSEKLITVYDMKLLWNMDTRNFFLSWVDVFIAFTTKVEADVPQSTNGLAGSLPRDTMSSSNLLKLLLDPDVEENPTRSSSAKVSRLRERIAYFFDFRNFQVNAQAEKMPGCLVLVAERACVEGVDYVEVVDDSGMVTSLEKEEMLWRIENMRGYLAPTYGSGDGDVHWIPSNKSNVEEICQLAVMTAVHEFPLFEKELHLSLMSMHFPELNLTMESYQYHIFTDIITNVLFGVVPKQAILDDAFETMRFRRQLLVDNENAPRLQQRLKTTRQDILYLEELIESADAEVELLQDEVKTKRHEYACIKESLRALTHRTKTEVLKDVRSHKSGFFTFKMTYHIEVGTWRLTRDHNLFAEMEIRDFKGTNLTNDHDSTIIINMQFRNVVVYNRLVNCFYPELLARETEGKDQPDDEPLPPMVHVYTKRMAPVGGINVIDHFEINIVPVCIQLQNDIFLRLADFFFPDSAEIQQKVNLAGQIDLRSAAAGASAVGNTGAIGGEGSSSSSSSITGDSKGKKSSSPFRRNTSNAKRKTTLADDSPGATQATTPADNISLMKYRASNTVAFNWIHVTGLVLSLSFKGQRDKTFNYEKIDFEDLTFYLSPLVYKSQVWTWQDLFSQLTRDIVRDVLGQLPQTLFRRGKKGKKKKRKDAGRLKDGVKEGVNALAMGVGGGSPDLVPGDKTESAQGNEQ